jgi:sulfatase maturation enzyme AslB (radical SAM superfamily)
MCDSKFSSKLINRDKLLGNPIYKKLEPNFQKLDLVDLSTLQRVKILGGEPFITPNFEKFIDYLIKRADPCNITIDIVTNATAIPRRELISKLNTFKFININVSLDSYDRANDYQRYGSNYKKTYNNSLKYREIFHNAEFSYHTTITTLTANKLSKTLNFFESNEDHYSVDFVRHPEHLSLLYIPDALSNWILDQNKNNAKAYSLVNTLLKESKYNETFWNKFVDTTQKLDKYYNTLLKDYNLELFNFLITNKLL